MNDIKIKNYIIKNYNFFIKLNQNEQVEVLKYYSKMNYTIFQYFLHIYSKIHLKNDNIKHQKYNKEQQRNNNFQQRQNDIQQRQNYYQQRNNNFQQRQNDIQQNHNISYQRNIEKNKSQKNIQTKKVLNLKPEKKINYENRLITKHYTISELIKNKRVVIVGPSPIMIGSGMGDFINNYDTIIRLNKSLPLPKNLISDIGNRTDILYNNLNTTDFKGENNLNLRIFIDENVKLIACPYPCIPPFNVDIQSFLLYNKNTISTHICDIQLYSQVCHQIKTRPNTGVMAIMDVLNHNPSELFICGMTFFKDGYYKEYRKISARENLSNIERIHKQLPQRLLIRNFYLLDNRLTMTNEVSKILLDEFIKIVIKFKDIDFKYLFFNYKTKAFKRIFKQLDKMEIDNEHIFFNDFKFTLYKTKLLKKKGKFIIYNRKKGIKNILVEDYSRYYKNMDNDSKKFMDEFNEDIILNPRLFAAIKEEVAKIGFNNEYFCIVILLKILFPKSNIIYNKLGFFDNLWIRFFTKYN